VLALFQGLAVGSMNVVAPLCGILTCVIPAAIGILLGDQLTAVELAGIALAVPAVALVSRQQPSASGPRRTGGAPLVLPFARRGLRAAAVPDARTLVTTAVAGILSGGANLLYLAATRYGELAIVGVLSSLYPAGTVLIARFRLSEYWSRTQIAGMIAAVLAVIFVVIG
jgi:drug/metabolite transporter (DMT)-like permease